MGLSGSLTHGRLLEGGDDDMARREDDGDKAKAESVIARSDPVAKSDEDKKRRREDVVSFCVVEVNRVSRKSALTSSSSWYWSCEA